MKNKEFISSNQDEQSKSEWEQVLGDHSGNAIGDGSFQTVEDFQREKAAREENYDPEQEAWEKAHLDPELQAHFKKMEAGQDDFAGETNIDRSTGRQRTNNAFDRFSTKGQNREQVSAAAALRRAFSSPEAVDAKLREKEEQFKQQEAQDRLDFSKRLAKFKAVNAERRARENLPPTALDYMNEELEDLQYGPTESYDAAPSNIRQTSESPESSAPHIDSSESSAATNAAATEPQPADTNPSFESAHLKWPEDTPDQEMDEAMNQAKVAIDHANDALESQKSSKNEELDEDEIAEINRVIAEMANSGDAKLVEIMHQKEYESDEDHKNRLVMMAKTEMRWRQLKKSIDDMRRHMKADNEALARTRDSLTRSRQIANAPRATDIPRATDASEAIGNPRLMTTPPEPNVTSAPESTTAAPRFTTISSPESASTTTPEATPEQKILKRDLAKHIRDVLRKRGETSAVDTQSSETSEFTSSKDSASRPEPKTTISSPESASTTAPEAAPEQKILKKDLKDLIRAKIAEREASSSSDSESFAKFAEYQRRTDHVDDQLNAERDKIIAGRPPSIRQKFSKIFDSLAKKFNEKSRKRAEKRRQEEMNPWLDDKDTWR